MAGCASNADDNVVPTISAGVYGQLLRPCDEKDCLAPVDPNETVAVFVDPTLDLVRPAFKFEDIDRRRSAPIVCAALLLAWIW